MQYWKKRQRCTEQTFRLCGRRWGWYVLREQHWNKYTIKGETDHQPGWMHERSAQGWCTGKTQRDGMGREVGGGIGWGIHVIPWLIHANVWQKPLQYCKVINLQLIKIDGKKIKYSLDEKKKKQNKTYYKINTFLSYWLKIIFLLLTIIPLLFQWVPFS